jgi:hypothetical protein
VSLTLSSLRRDRTQPKLTADQRDALIAQLLADQSTDDRPATLSELHAAYSLAANRLSGVATRKRMAENDLEVLDRRQREVLRDSPKVRHPAIVAQFDRHRGNAHAVLAEIAQPLAEAEVARLQPAEDQYRSAVKAAMRAHNAVRPKVAREALDAALQRLSDTRAAMTEADGYQDARRLAGRVADAEVDALLLARWVAQVEREVRKK